MSGVRQLSGMAASPKVLRVADVQDLDAINRIIERAIMTWELPERVKRLSLPCYRYDEQDLKTGELVVIEDRQGCITGVAAWEQAAPRDTPKGYRALQLHGIYVDPAHQHEGIGGRLILAAEQAAILNGYDGLLVKAQSGAAGFFLAQGMQPMEVEDTRRDYTHRYWKLLTR